MANALIACRSVTYAQRAVRLLEQNGLRASMRKLPANLPETGCGHAVRVQRERLAQAIQLMKDSGFPVKYHFCEEENGEVVICP
jgi:type III secretory pathway lipoprotein EscJ